MQQLWLKPLTSSYIDQSGLARSLATQVCMRHSQAQACRLTLKLKEYSTIVYILIHVKTSLREQTACCHGSSCFELQHTVIVLQDSPERYLGPDLLKSPKLAGRAEAIVRYIAVTISPISQVYMWPGTPSRAPG